MEEGFLQGETGPDGGVQLAGGHHVDAHALLLHDLIHPLEAQGLAGVQGHGAGRQMLGHGGQIFPAAQADGLLIHQHEGSAIFLCQFGGVIAGKNQMTRFVDAQIFVQHSDLSSRKWCVYSIWASISSRLMGDRSAGAASKIVWQPVMPRAFMRMAARAQATSTLAVN